MDIVIPLGKGSRNNNTELRYALRSFEMFIPDIENVFVIGEKADFLSEAVIHIPANDQIGPSYKALNIFRKILECCYNKRVSDDFIFCNDDHFLLKPWEGKNYYSGTLASYRHRVSEPYLHTINNTLMIGIGNYFDIHCPIVFNKEKFKRSVGSLSWAKPHGYCIKTVYCWLNGITGEPYEDMKTSSIPVLGNRKFFSTGDKKLSEYMIKVLDQLYPKPSQYEV